MESQAAPEYFIVDKSRLVNLSKKTDYPINHEYASWEYLRHIPNEHHHRAPEVGEQGVDNTKFKVGFNRRLQSQINQDQDRIEREVIAFAPFIFMLLYVL